MKPMTKKEILDSLGRPKWNLGIVALAIAAKKVSREEKGSVFNCFMLNNDEDELLKFLTLLQENFSSFEDGFHFQVAVRIKDSLHWCGLDFLIEKDNSGNPKLKVFCIDASGSNNGIATLNIVKKVFPNSSRYFYKSEVYETVVNAEGKVKEKKMDIQFSLTGCIRFTLDQLPRLGEFNYFEHLEANHNLSPDMWGDIPVPTSQLPHELAFLFRAVQSTTVLSKLPDKMRNQIVSRKGFNLTEYVEKRAIKDETGKIIPKAIESKKESFEQSVTNLLHTISEEDCFETQIKANGFDFIITYSKEEQLLKKEQIENNALPIHFLIKEIGIKIVEILNSPKPNSLVLFQTSTRSNSINILKQCVVELEKFEVQHTSTHVADIDFTQVKETIGKFVLQLPKPLAAWLDNQTNTLFSSKEHNFKLSR